MSDAQITTITVDGQEFPVYALGIYVTPYYYVPLRLYGPDLRFGGRAAHYDTLRKLENYVRRQLRKGKRQA
jgi:hypothetical protein